MADGEALKLPRPLPGSDFLTFQADRRWDLLGFVKSDEIEEIRSCNVGQDGHRYYLIHWKDSWKPESSLIYCEKLLQDFWSKKSLVSQEKDTQAKHHDENKIRTSTLTSPAEANQNDTLTQNNTTVATGSHLDGNEPEEVNDKQKQSVDNELDDAAIEEDVNFIMQGEEREAIANAKDFTFIASTEVTNEKEAEAESNAATAVTQEVVKAVVPEDDPDMVVEGSMKINVSVEHSVDSPSKKGAPKRKARPPRQSVHSFEAKSTLARKKDKIKKVKEKLRKIKEKGKEPKISKIISTVIDPDIVAPAEIGQEGTVNNEEIADKMNGNSSNLKCMVCDKHLSSEQNLMKHLLTHNNNHTCTICMTTFKSTHFLKHHMDKHNSSYQYSCPVCDKKFKFKNNMRGHLRKHNMEKKFECEICQKKFIGRYNLKEHMKAHSDNRPYECDFCKKAYKDRGALNKHLLTHQEKKVECEICKRPFTNMAQVKRHMQFHYSWPGDSFKRKSNIGPDGEKLKYNCQFCDKTFNHYSNMNAHVHKKHKEKKIQCTECPKTFAYQYELREHMFIHLGGVSSKFKCQFCEKSFQRSTTLKNHERTTHLGIKRFKCEICNKMFGTKFNMKVHVEKLHSDNADGTESKTRKPRANRNVQREQDVGNTTMPTTNNHLIQQIPVSVPPIHQHPLLRNISTSDIIRNAISHIPELGYFQPLQPHARGYQFYGMPTSDFNVT